MRIFLGALLLSTSLSVSVGAAPLQAQDSSQAHKFSLAAANDEWTNTGLKFSQGDLLVIFATGKVTIGAAMGEVDADGRNDSGTLVSYGFIEGKFGAGSPLRVGQRFALTVTSPGTLKLRVSDSQYRDNSGSYSVTVIRIPFSQVPFVENYTPED